MGGRGVLIEKIKHFFQKIFQEGDKSSKKRYVIAIGLIGLLFIIFSNLFSTNNNNNEQVQLAIEKEDNAEVHTDEDLLLTTNVTEIEKKYELDLEKMLNSIQGVSSADVMVNLSSTNVKVYEKNKSIARQSTEENDKSGGERIVEDETEDSEVVFVREGDREVPLLMQTNKPDVKGVLIIAQGAEHVEIKKLIVESVARVLDVPTHRISVMPKVKGDN